MSIEELFKTVIVALETNTKAVNALEASLQGRTPSKSAEKPKVEVKEEKAPKEDPKPEVKTEVKEEPKPETRATSYETLRELVLRLASGGQREGIKAVSAKHGIGAPKDLLKDGNDYTSVTDQDKLEAVYVDLLALEA